MNKKISLIFIFTALYAIFRYHVFGPVLFKDLFLYTFNKIIIFSAVIMMVRSVFIADNKEKKVLQKWIFILVSLHVLFSIQLIRPYYFQSFFTPENDFSLKGNLVLMGGGLAAILMFFKEKINAGVRLFSLLLLLTLSFHLIVMGWEGWLKPGEWHGMMPPITLVSYLLLLIWYWKR